MVESDFVLGCLGVLGHQSYHHVLIQVLLPERNHVLGVTHMSQLKTLYQMIKDTLNYTKLKCMYAMLHCRRVCVEVLFSDIQCRHKSLSAVMGLLGCSTYTKNFIEVFLLLIRAGFFILEFRRQILKFYGELAIFALKLHKNCRIFSLGLKFASV